MIPYGLIQTVAPVAEPIVLDTEFRTHLRLDGHGKDNTLVGSYLAASREYVEKVTGLQCMTSTWQMVLRQFPGRNIDDQAPPGWRWGVIRMPRPPLQSVTSIQYVDTDGVTQTLATSEYQVAAKMRPGRVAPARFKTWPVADPYTIETVTITFVAGFTSAALVPETVKQAIRLLTTHLYENRQVAVDKALAVIPTGLASFIRSSWTGEVR